MADIYGTPGNDTGINKLVGTSNADKIYGLAGFDTIEGLGGTDDLFGDEGDDFIYGGSGADYLYGGSGNDTLDGGSGADDLIGGSGSNDFARYASSGSGVKIDLTAGTGSGGQAAGDTLQSIEGLIGSEYADELNGDSANNNFYGGGGNDTLRGNGGNDTLRGNGGNDAIKGGAGADTIIGGTGTDTATYAGSNEGVYVDILSNATLFGHAQNDKLFEIENLVGSAHNDYLHGDLGANRLEGGDGDDLMNGDDGADKFFGGNGSDGVSYLDSSDGVTVNLESGSASGGDATGDTFSSIENLLGSYDRDKLTGNAANNYLEGRGGMDELRGGAGSDELHGGWQIDKLWGGTGADIFAWDQLQDSPTNSLAPDIIYDFSHAQGDKLDFSGITELNGNLNWRGMGNFTGADQARYYWDNGATFVEINATGGVAPEMRVMLTGIHSLVSSDFVV